MITLAPIFAVMCLVSAAPSQSGGDAYHQAVDYQGQAQVQQHVIDFQQHLQQNHAQEFQGHQHQQAQTFEPQGFHQGHHDVNSGISHGQVQNTQGDAKILIYQFDTDEHSNYQYAYETDNGIRAQEVGSNTGDGIKTQGAYSYTGDDGQVYTVTYTADENGFHPSGAHLPVPPPIPEAIARSIEKNLQDEANGIHDDGQYYPQQSEQYTQQSEPKPQISAAPKKYRQKAQVKDIKQQRPVEIQQQQITLQQPQQQIVVVQPRHQIKPQQVKTQTVQQTHQIIQQTPHKVVLQPQHQTARRPQHILSNSQQHLQLQAHDPAKYVVRHKPRHQQHPAAPHQQTQALLHQKNVDQVHLQGGFVPKYEVKENQLDVKEPEVQKQHIVEYHLPAAQNTLTEERHKVEYVVPSMKQFLEQFKPGKERQVVYQVQIPTYTQQKPAQDYIGPAPVPVAEYQHYQ